MKPLDQDIDLPLGKPYEVLLRNDDDIEMCDLVQATISILPDKFFTTSGWQIINSYFAKRTIEN